MNVAAQQLYTDTFRLQDVPQAVDMDVVLLDMIAEQNTLTIAERMRLDSIEREIKEIDSIRTLNAALVLQKMERIPTIEIEKSWVKDAEEDRNDVLRAIRNMRSPWRREATLMLQISQNYVTANWYQGGSSSFAALGTAKGQISYISERFTWENFGEWRRMGGSTVSADSLHKINTTDDMFRIYSKANLRIVPKLFTSVSAEIETRLLPTYQANSNMLKSAPFSPFRFNAAFGIDYKPVKNLSISVSPVSYKMIHIMDTARVLVREVALESKFYFYTNYHDVELDLEVNCDFIITRFMSARLILHPRYDTSVIMQGDTHAKIQFRELLSIGFAHKFH